ncbi:PREDICTED: F-box protein At1g61340-like [Camelina sativa]|uniref:F-box protein At1g61340-like n=1 Tax=Camelina sativa TaxID=90675 RepID=A0ABM0TRG7_CAMSA|nr:PREDICTED: F-box protein At1g61340-like [Camelina sativa]
MALGKKRIVTQKSNLKHRRDVGDGGGLGLELEFVQYKRGFGRKRILISSGDDDEIVGDSVFTSPVGRSSFKKLCDKASSVGDCQIRELEDLPQDILVRIICGVEHEDLKQLFQVSKTIKEATSIAKELHFAYSTPRKASSFNLGGFGWDKRFDAENDDEEIEAPGAPLQKRYRLSRINRNEDDSGVSVALFN